MDFVLKTASGNFEISDKFMHIKSKSDSINIAISSIQKVELVKFGYSTLINLSTSEIGNIFILIPRINIANLFVISNYIKTKELYNKIKSNLEK